MNEDIVELRPETSLTLTTGGGRWRRTPRLHSLGGRVRSTCELLYFPSVEYNERSRFGPPSLPSLPRTVLESKACRRTKLGCSANRWSEFSGRRESVVQTYSVGATIAPGLTDVGMPANRIESDRHRRRTNRTGLPGGWCYANAALPVCSYPQARAAVLCLQISAWSNKPGGGTYPSPRAHHMAHPILHRAPRPDISKRLRIRRLPRHLDGLIPERKRLEC